MNKKKILITFIISLIFIFLGCTKSNASLYLNDLKFDAVVNKDGTMDVTEIWDIHISETNTLYKTFKIDKSKYSSIENVTVEEINSNGGSVKDFTETNKWAYHLNKGYYFGGMNKEREFEIAWGVGLDSSSDTRIYKIKYTVVDAIAKYNDCAELYWQFIGDNFEVNAENVTGTVTLPSKAVSKDDIKVWGHIKTLNGEIYVTDLNKVSFNIKDYSHGNYLEIRIAMPKDMIQTTGRDHSNTSKLSSIIREETKWAEEANRIREKNERIENTIVISILLIGLGLTIFLATKIGKYRKILKEMQKFKPTIQLDYFRDIPDETATPIQAIFLKRNRK